jgi:hypothetical protein
MEMKIQFFSIFVPNGGRSKIDGTLGKSFDDIAFDGVIFFKTHFKEERRDTIDAIL